MSGASKGLSWNMCLADSGSHSGWRPATLSGEDSQTGGLQLFVWGHIRACQAQGPAWALVLRHSMRAQQRPVQQADPALRASSQLVGETRQWPEVYDLCHTFLHVALVRKHTNMRESHAKLV